MPILFLYFICIFSQYNVFIDLCRWKGPPKFSKITKLLYFYNDQVEPNCSCLILSIIIPYYELYHRKIFWIPACLVTILCCLFSILNISVLLTGSTSASSNLADCHCVSLKSYHYHHQWSVSITSFCPASRLSQIQNKKYRKQTISTASLATGKNQNH